MKDLDRPFLRQIPKIQSLSHIITLDGNCKGFNSYQIIVQIIKHSIKMYPILLEVNGRRALTLGKNPHEFFLLWENKWKNKASAFWNISVWEGFLVLVAPFKPHHSSFHKVSIMLEELSDLLMGQNKSPEI